MRVRAGWAALLLATVGAGCTALLGIDGEVQIVASGGAGGTGNPGGGGAGASGGMGGGGAPPIPCDAVIDCPEQSNDCQTVTCDEVCVVELLDLNEPCDDDGGEVCNGQGDCKLANGTACTDPAACASNKCVDGVCCNVDCSNTCNSCLGASTGSADGVCQPISRGTDPENECTDPTVCDGVNACHNGVVLRDLLIEGLVPFAMARDPSDGHFVVAGSYTGTPVIPGLGALPASGEASIFILEVDEALMPVWVRGLGTTGRQVASAVAVSPVGGVFVCGSYDHAALDLGGGTLPYQPPLDDGFVLKLDPSGNYAWAKTLNGSESDAPADIATLPTGDVAIVAGYSDVLTLPGAGSPLTNFPGGGTVLFRLDGPNGNLLWGQEWGAAVGEGASLSADASGKLLVATTVEGSFTFFGAAVSAVNKDMLVAKIAGNGTLDWVKHNWGGSFDQFAADIAAGPADHVFLSGQFQAQLTFGSASYNAGSGHPDAYVAELDESDVAPNAVWSASVPQSSEPEGASNLAVLAGVPSLVWGGFYEGGNFGPAGTDLPNTLGSANSFVVKSNIGGAHLWARSFEGGAHHLRALGLAPNGGVYTSGVLDGAVTVGNVAFSSTDDALLLLLLSP